MTRFAYTSYLKIMTDLRNYSRGTSFNETKLLNQINIIDAIIIDLCPAISGPVHTKTIVNANASKRKLFYAFRPSVHTKTMKTLTVNA